MTKENHIKVWLLHIVGSVCFLSLPFLFSPPLDPDQQTIFRPYLLMDLMNYSILLILFYVNYYFLIPDLYFKKKYVLFFIGLLIGFSLLLFVHLLIPHEIPKPPVNKQGITPPAFRPVRENFVIREIRHHLFQFLAVIGFSFFLKFYNRWKQTDKEKTSAELSYLKSQINPHFLFNTLNSIYSLALEKSDHTATAVVKLSGMMRYVITETKNDLVPVSKELNYISDFIDLQRIRLGNTADVEFRVQGSAGSLSIAPMLLIAFIENAFKHGVNAEENSKIKVEINLQDQQLEMNVFNNKVTVHSREEEKSGLGIRNAKHRLDLIYPSRHTLDIIETEKDFQVHLILNLSE